MRPDLVEKGDELPIDWWGPAWAPRSRKSLADLIKDGLLPLDLAAMLWGLIERGASVIVAAGPSGAGKTTLLTALLEFLPRSKGRFAARGMYETFLTLAAADPAATAILVNEISPHLPMYLWGPPVRRLFELGRSGFQFFATVHAETVEEFVYCLSAHPLKIAPRDLGTVDLLIFLKTWREGANVRREIDRVTALRAGDPAGLEAIVLHHRGEPAPAAVARAFGIDSGGARAFAVDQERRVAELWSRLQG